MNLKQKLRKFWYFYQNQNRQRWTIDQYKYINNKNTVSGFIGYTAFAGLANRMRAHTAALIFSHFSSLPVVPIWQVNKQCGANFLDIFDDTSNNNILGFTKINLVEKSEQKPFLNQLQQDSLNILHYSWQFFDSFSWIKKQNLKKIVIDKLNFKKEIIDMQNCQLKKSCELSIGVHIRRGDFVTHTSYARPIESYYNSIDKMIQNTMCKNITIFISTDDSIEIKNEIKKRYNKYNVIWNNFHTLREQKDSIKNACADLLDLASCDKLVLTPKSSFGDFASFLSNKEQDIIIVD